MIDPAAVTKVVVRDTFAVESMFDGPAALATSSAKAWRLRALRAAV
jgi:hypothetical protein